MQSTVSSDRKILGKSDCIETTANEIDNRISLNKLF